MRRLLPTLLDTLAAVFVIVALLLAVLPLSTEVPAAHHELPRESAIATPAALTRTNDTDDQPTRIVAANLFSASRRAPRTAFVAPGQDYGAPASFVGDTDATAESSTAPDVVLEGIVTHEGRALALIRVAPSSSSGEEPAMESSTSSPRLLGVGERIGNFRVHTIGSDHVVLTSGSGVRTLRLHRPLSSDSSAQRP